VGFKLILLSPDESEEGPSALLKVILSPKV